MRHLLMTAALMMPLPALADDVALVLGAERYERLSRVARADDLLAAVDRLEALGFDVFSRANPRIDAARDLAEAFQDGVPGADRLIVALSGHFVTDGSRTWLLTAEARTPDLFTVDQQGVSLDSLLQILAQRPGQAVLLLGTREDTDLDLDGSVLRSGLGRLNIPQGVTVVQAPPVAAAAVLRGTLTEPDAVIGAQLLANPSIETLGYLPANWQLMPDVAEVVEVPVTTGPTQAELNAEAALWDRATDADTIESYHAYLARYPQGRFVDEAEERIEAIAAEPNRTARLREEALQLQRNERRSIQANLTLLEYNTRGVDGIFGPGTRGAITNWQQSNGFPQTSYLTREQINLLDAQAARRKAEIEAEEARDRARAEARDRAYWEETGALGDEPGYRAYLDRYPEGLFANIARARLGAIEDRRQAEAEEADRAAWRVASGIDTAPAYQEYLAAYPNGVFSDQARARIADLTEPRISEAEISQARAEERRLQLSGIRAQLLELRLQDLGHNPGRIDGVIDENTRRAIAAYQQSEGITATGFVDQQTAVGLMTGSIQFNLQTR